MQTPLRDGWRNGLGLRTYDLCQSGHSRSHHIRDSRRIFKRQRQDRGRRDDYVITGDYWGFVSQERSFYWLGRDCFRTQIWQMNTKTAPGRLGEAWIPSNHRWFSAGMLVPPPTWLHPSLLTNVDTIRRRYLVCYSIAPNHSGPLPWESREAFKRR